MSGKKAKEERRIGPIAEVKIIVYPDNRIEVRGFPMNLIAAMNIMNAGTARVAQHFAIQAKEGNLDENLNLEQSRIIKPKMQVTLH